MIYILSSAKHGDVPPEMSSQKWLMDHLHRSQLTIKRDFLSMFSNACPSVQIEDLGTQYVPLYLDLQAWPILNSLEDDLHIIGQKYEGIKLVQT